jgi:Sortase domain
VPKDQSTSAPMRLLIPRIGLSAGILALGPAANGAMQAPERGGPDDPIWGEVYWWKVGTIPGQSGNAVIAGHVNRPDGSPSTFTYLDNLRVGDSIEVQTAGGQTLIFRVTEKATPSAYVHRSNDPTMGRIFGPALAPHLNLITCWGQWDGKDYNQRLVIYSTLVRATTATPASNNGPRQQERRARQLPAATDSSAGVSPAWFQTVCHLPPGGVRAYVPSRRHWLKDQWIVLPSIAMGCTRGHEAPRSSYIQARPLWST